MLSPEKIHERLFNLGVLDAPAPNTIAKYITKAPKTPSEKQIQSWKMFLHNHRKIEHFAVTSNPTSAWVAQQIWEATPYGATPEFLIHDNDSIFTSAYFQQFLKNTKIKPKIPVTTALGKMVFVRGLAALSAENCLIISFLSMKGILNTFFVNVTCVLQIAIFFVSLNLLRVELGDATMFKFWIFTQVIICCVPGLFWEKRGTRIGACWQLNIVLLLVAIMSFNPSNMWALISPHYFSVANNPWFYVVGAVTLFFAIRGCLVYAKLPKNPDVLENGKKPIF
ncbi:hypothetical protein LPY66_13425 [Dehalobacter sp. DCM]|uniref:hypothetical protein n=1 Tax=Dehalobacter sp. DCM TaxID=2907827 RepID=UPI0030818BA7|nr:hypothetical protein LPY66_13425 [Dehalobacter sp. DCM]